MNDITDQEYQDAPDMSDAGDLMPWHEADPQDPVQDLIEGEQPEQQDEEPFDPLTNPYHAQVIQMWAQRMGLGPQQQQAPAEPDFDPTAWEDPQEAMDRKLQELMSWKQAQEQERQNTAIISHTTDVIRQIQGPEAAQYASGIFALEPGIAQGYAQGVPQIIDIVDNYIRGKQAGSVVQQLQNGARQAPTAIQAQSGQTQVPEKAMEIARQLYGETPTAAQISDVVGSMKRMGTK